MRKEEGQTETRTYEQEAEERRERRRRRRKKTLAARMAVLAVLLLLLAAAALFLGRTAYVRMRGSGSIFPGAGPETLAVTEAPTEPPATEIPAETEAPSTEPPTEPPMPDHTPELNEAARLAQGYDYDGAIASLTAIPGYEADGAVTAAIHDYENARDACVAVDVTQVPHIFYHSLLNDTDRAFNVEKLGQFTVDGMNAWMTTVEEFDKITQKLYDNGYVYVRLRDLVVETTDESGRVSFTPNTQLMLPPDKKAIVLSVDDLSYYHSYEAAGFPDKLVLDENGRVKCHYVSADGTEQVGDFDVVPRLNAFLEEHPDGAYKGARGLIAMTGYNGVFGYRTDSDYELREHLMEDQQKWLDAHPDFSRAAEIEEATKIANAIKAEGWEFASHTWGHLSVTSKTLDELKADNEKWVNNVQNIVGPVDTIIFAHGNDIGSWEGYSEDNEVYAYFKSAGYNFYCNVDGSVPYWVQITGDYVRQGRIDLDGYMLYQSSIGNTTVIDGLFPASEVFDSRRPTPVVANGES